MRTEEEIREELNKLYRGRKQRENPKSVEDIQCMESRVGRYYVGEAEGWIQSLEWVLGIRKEP